jgi:hypothetical protein
MIHVRKGFAEGGRDFTWGLSQIPPHFRLMGGALPGIRDCEQEVELVLGVYTDQEESMEFSPFREPGSRCFSHFVWRPNQGHPPGWFGKGDEWKVWEGENL